MKSRTPYRINNGPSLLEQLYEQAKREEAAKQACCVLVRSLREEDIAPKRNAVHAGKAPRSIPN